MFIKQERIYNDRRFLKPNQVKMGKEEVATDEFVERRRCQLERFLRRVSRHPVLVADPDFREFLELEGDLPKSTHTSALSGAGVIKLISRVGDTVNKITYKMDENDSVSILCFAIIV